MTLSANPRSSATPTLESTVQITATTDLTEFIGQRVVINGIRAARIQTITHYHEDQTSSFACLNGGIGGNCVEDPHGGCRGGATSFWWPYGTDLRLEERAA